MPGFVNQDVDIVFRGYELGKIDRLASVRVLLRFGPNTENFPAVFIRTARAPLRHGLPE